jgi:hypothetical protein
MKMNHDHLGGRWLESLKYFSRFQRFDLPHIAQWFRTVGSNLTWWGEATDEPSLLRCETPNPAREDARPTGGWDRYRYQTFSRVAALLLVSAPGFLSAQTALDEQAPWPRVRSTNGYTVTIYLPQVESWNTNSFVARSVVEVKPPNGKKALLGVVWLGAHGDVDRVNRIVHLDRFKITRANFPDAPDGGTNALAIVREIVPSGARTVSFDYLITALGFEQAAARQHNQELNHTPPDIIWSTNRAVLILVDGDPVLRPVADSTLERVINTPALLVRDKATGRFYLSGEDQWFAADSIHGPWSLAQVPPAPVKALSLAKTAGSPAGAGEPAPRIIVRTRPAELLLTDGLPNFQTVRGTSLQAAVNSDCQLFYYTPGREAYLLLSGRWFKAASLQGPWTYVSPHDLPDDFAKIPPNTPQGIVLASVPGTPQAELALVADSVPTTATVSRRATTQVTFDGEPEFKVIEGTGMSYALNAQLPVIQAGDNYYALDNGVWFVSAAPEGPWAVATEVPEEIYTIPPSSPVYYATFARVYDSNTNEVEAGYTPGYTGAYEDEGTSVYGTGYEYPSWYSTTTYYGWGWSWGYGHVYVPWDGWWTWRPWWSMRSGIRAALIDNIYDRWQSGIVTPHDRAAGKANRAAQWRGYSGYPALYGRFSGTTRPAAMTPPADTIALNPYSRPQTRWRSGEVPHGAQLLTTVQRSPGAGRDLYASPDGNIYQRRADGWYRSQGAGKWSYYAPAQGTLKRGPVAGTLGGQPAGPADVYRMNASGNVPVRTQVGGNPEPNLGVEARAQDVAALDRQYYARNLGQARAQNSLPNYSAPSPAPRPVPVRGFRGGRVGGR